MLLTLERLGPGRFVLYAISAAVAAFLLLPVVFIALFSFGSSEWLQFPPPSWTLRWYRALLADPRWVAAFWTSARIATTVMVLSVALGLPVSFALVRGRFPGRTALHAFFVSPLVIPVIILGIGLYAIFLAIGLNGTFWAFVAGHLILALPFSVVCISNALLGFDDAIEQAAVVCGASPIRAAWRVTIPSIRVGILSGALFSFLLSWDEVVLSIFLASPTLQPISVKIWTTLQLELSPVIAAVSTVLILLTIAVMGTAYLVRRRASQ
jgi:putative spermidine/putrescine transport system permease protein